MYPRLGGLASVALMVGALVLASCSSTPTSPVTSVGSTTATKPYGSLIVGVDFQQGTFDPLIGRRAEFLNLGAPILDSLVELNPQGGASPGIAERWEISPDGMTHTFYIRKGVKFHDGTDLTAEDVRFSIARLLSSDATSSESAVWRASADKVEVKDEYTVLLRMKTPQFALLTGFDPFTGAAAVVPKKYIEAKGVEYFRRNPIGSGPWKVVSFQPGVRLELEAVESHWRAVPKFKNITLLNVAEEASKVAMLKTGELDIADVSSDSVPGLKAAGLRIHGDPGANKYLGYIWYDLNNPLKYPLGDARVRRAVSLAINRQELVDKLLNGLAKPAGFVYMPKASYYYDPDLAKADPYDPEGAKKLLAEAGYANGFNTKIWTTVASDSRFNEAVSGYWRRVGVNAEIVPITGVAMVERGRSSSAELLNTVWLLSSAGIQGFEVMTKVLQSTTSNLKTTRNPRLDELFDRVPRTSDPAEKKRLAVEAVRLARDGYDLLNILFFDVAFALGPKVGAITISEGMGTLGPYLDTITHAK